MIAVRGAIRVLPLVLPNAQGAPNWARLTLQIVRANFLGWTACLSRDYASSLEPACRAAADAANAASTDVEGYAAATDLDTAFAAARAASTSVEIFTGIEARGLFNSKVDDAAQFAATAVIRASSGSINKVNITGWEDISADANWLLQNVSKTSSSLIQQPLWLRDVRSNKKYKANFPDWARTPFDAFDKSEWAVNGPWRVWLAWYRELLVGTRQVKSPSFSAKRAFEIASMDEAFWRADPHRVTASVAALVGWKWQESSWTWPDEIESGLPDETKVKEEPATEVLKPTAPRPIESVKPQSDEPTDDDRLNRKPFAQALVERLDDVFEKGAPDGFAVHIHAPWGAGKTSVLKMMRNLMTDSNRTAKDGKVAPQWVVVEFNAWKNERRNPPWWPLVEEVKSACLKSLSSEKLGWVRLGKACGARLWRIGNPAKNQIEDKAALLQVRWLWWKIRTDLIQYLLAGVVAVFCLWLLWSAGASADGKIPAIFDLILKLIAASTAAYVAFLGASRIAVFGSATAAKFYEDISHDPLKRITELFRSIISKVEETKKPVCVFVDDLDRCGADYVVDLLEGIQTSFRHPNIAYVVAADRAWIRASFEARYGKFFDTVGTAGQPLGYLFVEKIFQVSTPLPGMGDLTRATYWDELVKGVRPPNEGAAPIDATAPAAASSSDRLIQEKRAALRSEHGGNLTRELADEALKKSNTPEDRAAVVLELTASPEAAAEAQHLLSQFKDIVPDIPRMMKRMVNAYALRQAIGLLENTDLSTAVLARWTILEQRYPALTDLLIEQPEWTEFIAQQVPVDAKDVPEPLKPFINTREIIGIIGSATDQALTAVRVRALTRGSST